MNVHQVAAQDVLAKMVTASSKEVAGQARGRDVLRCRLLLLGKIEFMGLNVQRRGGGSLCKERSRARSYGGRDLPRTWFVGRMACWETSLNVHIICKISVVAIILPIDLA